MLQGSSTKTISKREESEITDTEQEELEKAKKKLAELKKRLQ